MNQPPGYRTIFKIKKLIKLIEFIKFISLLKQFKDWIKDLYWLKQSIRYISKDTSDNGIKLSTQLDFNGLSILR